MRKPPRFWDSFQTYSGSASPTDPKTIGMTVRYSHLASKHTLAAVERLDTPTEQPIDTTTDTKGLERVSVEEPILQQVIQ